MIRSRGAHFKSKRELQIDMHVERLNLHGLDLRHRERFVSAFHSEMRSQLAAADLPRWVLESGRLDLEHARFDTPAGAGPETAAAALAQSITDRVQHAEPPGETQ